MRQGILVLVQIYQETRNFFLILSLYKFKMYFSLRMVSKRKYFILFLLKQEQISQIKTFPNFLWGRQKYFLNFKVNIYFINIIYFYMITKKAIFFIFLAFIFQGYCQKLLIHNLDSLSENFQNQFCLGCQYTEETCKKNLNYVDSFTTNNFTIETIKNNKFQIKSVFSVVKSIRGNYSFQNKNLIQKNMEYIAFMPEFQKKQTLLQGVIIYYHPTIFGRKQVPSKKGNQIEALAALYCSQGYSIVFIDYLGYDKDQDEPYPYLLFPQQNVQSAIAALNDIRPTLSGRYNYNQYFNLFAVGYSEGASYSLWMEKCLNSNCPYNKLTLCQVYRFRGTAALAGPYDLAEVLEPFLQEDISIKNNTFAIMDQNLTNFRKPSSIAMVINSFCFYQNIYNMSRIYQAQFNILNCSSELYQFCQLNRRFKNISKIIRSEEASMNIAKAIAFSAIGKSLNNRKYLSPQSSQTGVSNSVLALVYQDVVRNQAFKSYLSTSSAIKNAPEHKTFIFSLERDSIVPIKNSQKYFQLYSSTNKVVFYKFPNQEHKICKEVGNLNVDHDGAQVLSNVYALAFIVNQTLLIN